MRSDTIDSAREDAWLMFVDSLQSSARSTPRTTPTPIPPVRSRRVFDPDASIVLIGIRGTGKSTLAIMASIACRRRVVDVEIQFQEATGFSTSKYRKQFGASNHNLRQEELLRNILQTHEKGAIIVCNGSSLERSGQILLQDFSKSHPVIHVLRDLESVHEHLEGLELSKLKDIVAFSAPMFRRCSNYEFYNISETFSVVSSPTFRAHRIADLRYLFRRPLINNPFLLFSPSSGQSGLFSNFSLLSRHP